MHLRHFYRVAAVCFLATVALLVTLNIAVAIVGTEHMAWLKHPPFLVRLPAGILGCVSVVGIVSLWFGMMWDCLFASKLAIRSKIGWFLLLLVTNMLGALIYYFGPFQSRETANN